MYSRRERTGSREAGGKAAQHAMTGSTRLLTLGGDAVYGRGQIERLLILLVAAIAVRVAVAHQVSRLPAVVS